KRFWLGWRGGPRPPVDPGRRQRVDLSVPLRVGKQRLIDQYERAYVTAMLGVVGGNVSQGAGRGGTALSASQAALARRWERESIALILALFAAPPTIVLVTGTAPGPDSAHIEA